MKIGYVSRISQLLCNFYRQLVLYEPNESDLEGQMLMELVAIQLIRLSLTLIIIFMAFIVREKIKVVLLRPMRTIGDSKQLDSAKKKLYSLCPTRGSGPTQVGAVSI